MRLVRKRICKKISHPTSNSGAKELQMGRWNLGAEGGGHAKKNLTPVTKHPILAPKSCKYNESAIGATYDEDDDGGGDGGGGDDIQFGRLQRATNFTIML
jgi:hypothetical protein